MGVVEFEPGAMARLRELTHQSSTAASVFILLLEWARPRKCSVEATYADLAREMQCSRATIGRAMRLLKEHEWIISKGGKHRLQRVRFTRVKHPDDPVVPIALYRHYSKDGELLYVGISKSAPARLAQHMAGSPWAREIARVEIEYLPDRERALEAEREAIQCEKPLWNMAHNNS